MVKTNIIALRYAQSAFATALELSKHEQVFENFKVVLLFLRQKSQDVALATSVKVPGRIKYKFWEDFCNTHKFGEVATNLILLLIKNGRIDALARIIEVFNDEYNKYKGIKTIEVVSAILPDDSIKSQVMKIMSDALKLEIELVWRVDPSIAGGMAIRVGAWQFDFSIKTRLNEIKQKLIAKNN